MLSNSRMHDLANAVPRLIGLASLFALTIWRYRKNRVIVLGVVTVCGFFAFASLGIVVDPRRVPSWVVGSVFSLILLSSLLVLTLAAIDAVRWMKGKRQTRADDKVRSTLHESGPK